MNIVDKILFDPITKGLKFFSRRGVMEFSTTPIGMSDAQATALGRKQYTSGVAYNGGISPTITGPNWTTNRSVIIPYQMQDGAWRIRFNIAGTLSTPSSNIALAMNGTTFKSFGAPGRQAIQATDNTSNQPAVNTFVMGGSSTLQSVFAGNTSEFEVFGDVELDSKPTWAY